MTHSNEIDDGVINLRADGADFDEPEFKINHNVGHQVVEEDEAPRLSATPTSTLEDAALQAHDKVKVKFDKFVNLIATHDVEDVMDKHLDDDVIISTDLLADLANAHEERGGENKLSVVFVVGLAIGIVVTWFLVN